MIIDDLAIIVTKGFEQTAAKEDIARPEARIVHLEEQIQALDSKVKNYIEDFLRLLRK